MPLRLIAKLDEVRDRVVSFREILADTPDSLARAEAHWVAYEEARAKIFDEVPKLYELRGIVAGLQLAVPSIRGRQEEVKREVEEERISSEAAKVALTVLSAATVSVVSAKDTRRSELARVAGQIDGIFWSAHAALNRISDVLRHFDESVRREDGEDDDWTGRGTDNGQRPPVDA